MASFSGVDHFSLSVTDLDRSEAFYTGVLGFMLLMDFGDVRVCLHRATGFTIALVRHAEGTGQAFSELHTGLDHIGFSAESRDELVEWADRFESANVPYTPIRDMPFGHHLNFRDPDNIPLEFSVANAFLAESLEELRNREVSREEIVARVQQYLDSAPIPPTEKRFEMSFHIRGGARPTARGAGPSSRRFPEDRTDDDSIGSVLHRQLASPGREGLPLGSA